MRLRLKTLLVLIITCFITCNFSFVIFADEEYKVVDESTGEVIETFSNYSSANYYYNSNVDEYDNLVLYHGDSVIKMEYGIVEFVTDNSCSLNVGYYSNIRKSNTSINGCYGIDGAYLYSSDSGNTVYFKAFGDVGSTSFDDVILHPLEKLDVRASTYANIDGVFYHQIKTQLNSDYYSLYPLDDKLDYLEDNVDYYSYDGHYFYSDFKTMIDDYNNDTYENSVNYESPYYNYYQHLPYRSLSNYSYTDLENYYYDTLKISDKLYSYDDQANDGANDVVNASQYYDEIENFFINQNLYGTNAMFLISTANLESSTGKSYKSFSENKLYNNVAYDSENETTNDRYNSIANSIYSYSKYYVSDKYSNYRSDNYAGTYLGNKLGGINLNYSLDSYYGEKIASNYYLLDKTLGYKDKNSYALGIVSGDSIRFYRDENLSKKYFTITNIYNYSLIILEELDDSYEVQIDPSFDSDYYYDFSSSIAYVDKDVFDLIFNEENIHENNLLAITCKNNVDDDEFEINVLDGSDYALYHKEIDGYEFVSYKQEDDYYLATYKKISDINILNGISSFTNLENGKIEILYEDGSSCKKKINSNMLYVEDDVTYINYCGVKKEIKVNESSTISNISTLIGDLDLSDLNNAKKIKEEIISNDYDFDFDSVRKLDETLYEEYKNDMKFHIVDNDYDLSVSGMSLSKVSDTSYNKFDTYYISIKKDNYDSSIENLANAYGFAIDDCFSISFSYNFNKLDDDGVMVYSIKPNDKTVDKIYSIYRIDGDKIVKCKTIQTSSYVKFLSKKAGKFILLSKDSSNNYDLEDYYENLNAENNSPDLHYMFLYGCALFAVIVYGLINIVLYMVLNKNIKNDGMKKIMSIK